MDKKHYESRHDRREELVDRDDSPRPVDEDMGLNGVEKSSKHDSRNKDRKKRSRAEDKERERDKDHRYKDRERSKKTSDDVSTDLDKEHLKYNEQGKDRIKDIKGKDHDRDRSREKERDKDKERKDRGKDKERDRGRETDKERGKEKNRDREIAKDKEREKENQKLKDLEKLRENDKDGDRKRGRENAKERELDQGKERSRERDGTSKEDRQDDPEWSKMLMGREYDGHKDVLTSFDGDQKNAERSSTGGQTSTSELRERIMKMKEERTSKSEASSEILSWGVTLDNRGHFSGEAEKKLEELRKRLQGGSTNNHTEDLNSSGKILSDYYSQEEMIQFKKPKKKKSLRKKDKLDIKALEEEAIAEVLGAGDLGSRNDGRRKAREEQETHEAELRTAAYQLALAKADEASKALRLGHTNPVSKEDIDDVMVDEEDDDLHKAIEKARKLALKKQKDAPVGPEAIARLATTLKTNQMTDDQNGATDEGQEGRVVFTEIEEFVCGLQFDEDANKSDTEDVFEEENDATAAIHEEREDMADGLTEANETVKDEDTTMEDAKEVTAAAETIHEVAVGKGLSGALKLLHERKHQLGWWKYGQEKEQACWYCRFNSPLSNFSIKPKAILKKQSSNLPIVMSSPNHSSRSQLFHLLHLIPIIDDQLHIYVVIVTARSTIHPSKEL